jgi:hypothetical protein
VSGGVCRRQRLRRRPDGPKAPRKWPCVKVVHFDYAFHDAREHRRYLRIARVSVMYLTVYAIFSYLRLKGTLDCICSPLKTIDRRLAVTSSTLKPWRLSHPVILTTSF